MHAAGLNEESQIFCRTRMGWIFGYLHRSLSLRSDPANCPRAIRWTSHRCKFEYAEGEVSLADSRVCRHSSDEHAMRSLTDLAFMAAR